MECAESAQSIRPRASFALLRAGKFCSTPRMGHHFTFAITTALALSAITASAADATTTTTNTARRAGTQFPRTEVKYQLGPDSQRKDGVPRGKITNFDWK